MISYYSDKKTLFKFISSATDEELIFALTKAEELYNASSDVDEKMELKKIINSIYKERKERDYKVSC